MNLRLLVFTTILSLVLFSGLKSQVIDSPPRNGVYDKIHNINREPIPYTPLREADVMWQRRIWRILDLRQKINQPFYFPTEPIAGKRSFPQAIWDLVMEGSLTAYEDENFLIPLTSDEVKDNNTQVSTRTVKSLLNPDIDSTVTSIDEFQAKDVKKIVLKEDWFFDKQRSVMDQRIIGFALRKVKRSESGEEIGEENIFWIYFPYSRQFLVQEEVFNRFNDSKRMTYDDLFWKRMFSSYIIKEENVYDRMIEDYAIGMDALLESERIKHEIFEYEHNLWNY